MIRFDPCAWSIVAIKQGADPGAHRCLASGLVDRGWCAGPIAAPKRPAPLAVSGGGVMARPGSRFHREIKGRLWDRARRRELARAAWRCERCGKAGRLEVHHVRPLHKGGAAYDPDNLKVLCRRCHIETHKRPLTDAARRWRELVQFILDG